MRKATKSDFPVGKLTKVKDFLPPPDKLAVLEETQKITISLKKSSDACFHDHPSRADRENRCMLQKSVAQRHAPGESQGCA